jgi:post-segregation antitoxin (ccd killing protein)
MVMINLQLPEDVEEKARAAGLLTSEKIAELIEAELDRQRQEAWQRLSQIMDQVSANFRAEYAHLTDEEAQAMIDQWIDEAHAERERDQSEPGS